MKKILALVLAAGAVGSAAAQTSVGVSIGINQPGVYGRIDIGDIPAPALVVPQPVFIAPPRVALAVPPAPMYLYVPPGHQKNWGRYCGRYNACGHPVYFVREDWVRERYEHEHPGWDNGKHKGWNKHDKHDDDDRGNGKGHGHGKHD